MTDPYKPCSSCAGPAHAPRECQHPGCGCDAAQSNCPQCGMHPSFHERYGMCPVFIVNTGQADAR